MATTDDNIGALLHDAADGATVVDLTAHARRLRWLWGSFFVALVLLGLNAAPTIIDMITSWRDFIREAYIPDKTELLRLISMLFVVLPFPLIVLNQKTLQLALSRQLRWGWRRLAELDRPRPRRARCRMHPGTKPNRQKALTTRCWRRHLQASHRRLRPSRSAPSARLRQFSRRCPSLLPEASCRSPTEAPAGMGG
jgi:hypothetical protein